MRRMKDSIYESVSTTMRFLAVLLRILPELRRSRSIVSRFGDIIGESREETSVTV